MGEFNAIHAATHENVCQEHSDIIAPFKDLNCAEAVGRR